MALVLTALYPMVCFIDYSSLIIASVTRPTLELTEADGLNVENCSLRLTIRGTQLIHYPLFLNVIPTGAMVELSTARTSLSLI